MTKVYIYDHNQVMGDLHKAFDIVDSIDDADAVLIWNDLNPFERSIIKCARSLGKKVYVIQHGRKGSSKYYPPFNEPITADKLLVWGEFDRRSLIAAGHDEKKIAVVGTTVFSHLKPRVPHKGINVVFCPEHWDRDVDENRQVKELLDKLKGVKLITKIIDSHDPSSYKNPIQSFRDTPEHLEICAEVLSTADLVVGISESTFELLAQSLNIPVVIMEEWSPKAFGGDMRYVNYRRVISPASKKTTLSMLIDTIKNQLEYPEELEEERKQVVIDEGGIHLDTLELLKKEING